MTVTAESRRASVIESTSDVLSAPLPARWSTLQRFKNTLIYGVVRIAFWLMQRVPLLVMWYAAWPLGMLANIVAVRERRRANKQLRAAIPELTDADRRSIVRRMFIHLARCGAELTHLPRMLRDGRYVHVSDAVRRLFDEALSEGKGVLVATGHIGNWELLAQVVANLGYPVSTIAGPLYDPRLTRWVDRERSGHGLGVIWRGNRGGSKEMLRVFRDQGILALLIDQDTRVKGVFVPFFGKPAHTPAAAAALALRAEAPMLVCWMHRHGRSHTVFAERCCVPLSGDRDTDTLALTCDATARLERAIRRAPEQWMWFHERWKRKQEDGA